MPRATDIALIGVFAVWAWPAVAWAARGEDAGTRLVLGLLGVALAIRGLSTGSGGRAPALLLVAVPLVGALVSRVVDLDTLHAIAVVVAAYGLVGLYTGRETWRRLRPLVLLALLLLPVGTFLDVGVGWPLRKATAAAAAAALGGVPVETVIRVDGAIAFVDLPCAGVRSLHTGAELLLLATIALRRPVDAAWCAIAAVGAVLLVAGNAARATAVVGLHHVLDQPLLAEIVHVPLGLASFAVAGLATGALLLGRPEVPADPGGPARPAPLGGVAAIGLALALAGSPTPPAPATTPILPAGIATEAPSEAEARFAAQHGGSIAKGRLADGTVALVASRSWLAHHVPEQCLEAAGWTVTEDRPALLGGVHVRIALATRDGETATAVWWFQSGARTTDDAVVRIRDGVATGAEWVLVSVLLDGDADPGRLSALVPLLGRAVEDAWKR